MSTNELFARLEKATRDLDFPSETDAPVLPFRWPREETEPTEADIIASSALVAELDDKTVQTLDFQEFFAPRTQEHDWQDDEQRETAKKLRALVELLQANLTDLRVYKVGARAFEVFVLGKSKDGEWIGVSTRVVET